MLRLCSRRDNYFQAEAEMAGNDTTRSGYLSFYPAHPAAPEAIGQNRAG